MNLRSGLLVALATAALGPGLANAGAGSATAGGVSLMALPISNTAARFSESMTSGPDGASAPAQFARWDGTRLESIRYRPRGERPRDDRPSRIDQSYGSHGFGDVHGGFFDPDGDLSNGALFGFRVGSSLDDRVELGLGLDWNHRSDRQSSVVREVPLPGGGTAEQHMELARSSSDLFPMLASVQVSPAPGMGIVPYIGAGAGWEVLFISGDDFTTGDKFDATYGGWGWQAWAGVAIPTSHWTKLNAEVFLNRSEVSRDVDDGAGRFTETVNMDGAGMRFGLTWGF